MVQTAKNNKSIKDVCGGSVVLCVEDLVGCALECVAAARFAARDPSPVPLCLPPSVCPRPMHTAAESAHPLGFCLTVYEPVAHFARQGASIQPVNPTSSHACNPFLPVTDVWRGWHNKTTVQAFGYGS